MLGTGSIKMIPLCWHLSETAPTLANDNYKDAPYNDFSVNDGPHIRRWSDKIIILYNNIKS